MHTRFDSANVYPTLSEIIAFANKAKDNEILMNSQGELLFHEKPGKLSRTRRLRVRIARFFNWFFRIRGSGDQTNQNEARADIQRQEIRAANHFGNLIREKFKGAQSYHGLTLMQNHGIPVGVTGSDDQLTKITGNCVNLMLMTAMNSANDVRQANLMYASERYIDRSNADDPSRYVKNLLQSMQIDLDQTSNRENFIDIYNNYICQMSADSKRKYDGEEDYFNFGRSSQDAAVDEVRVGANFLPCSRWMQNAANNKEFADCIHKCILVNMDELAHLITAVKDQNPMQIARICVRMNENIQNFRTFTGDQQNLLTMAEYDWMNMQEFIIKVSFANINSMQSGTEKLISLVDDMSSDKNRKTMVNIGYCAKNFDINNFDNTTQNEQYLIKLASASKTPDSAVSPLTAIFLQNLDVLETLPELEDYCFSHKLAEIKRQLDVGRDMADTRNHVRLDNVLEISDIKKGFAYELFRYPITIDDKLKLENPFIDYSLHHMEWNRNSAKDIFNDVTGLVWDEMYPDEKQRAVQIFEEKSVAACNGNVDIERYLQLNKDTLVQAIKDPEYFSELREQSIEYIFFNLDEDRGYARQSLAHCTGLKWREMGDPERKRTANLCNAMAEAARMAGLPAEDYLVQMQGVIRLAVEDDEYYRQLDETIASAGEALCQIPEQLKYIKNFQSGDEYKELELERECLDFVESVTSNITAPLAVLAQQADPRPSLELLTALLYWRHLEKMNKELIMDFKFSQDDVEPTILSKILMTSRLASYNVSTVSGPSAPELDQLALEDAFNLVPLRFFTKMAFRDWALAVNNEDKSLQSVSDERKWLDSDLMTKEESEEVRASRDYPVLSSKYLHDFEDKIVSALPPSAYISPGEHGIEIFDGEDDLKAILREKMLIALRKLNKDTSPSDLETRENQPMNQTQADNVSKTAHMADLGATSADHLQFTIEEGNQIAKQLGYDWTTLNSSRKNAINGFYARCIAPIRNEATSMEQIIEDNKLVFRTILTSGSSHWKKLSELMDELRNVVFELGASNSNLKASTDRMVKCVTILGKIQSDCRNIYRAGALNEETIVKAVVNELSEQNSEALASFADSMDNNDNFAKIFFVQKSLASEIPTSNKNLQNELDYGAFGFDLGRICQPIVAAAYKAKENRTGPKWELSSCQKILAADTEEKLNAFVAENPGFKLSSVAMRKLHQTMTDAMITTAAELKTYSKEGMKAKK